MDPSSAKGPSVCMSPAELPTPDRGLRLWVVAMAAATLWYAWPQFFYSLFFGYDLLRTFLPQWAERLQPLVDVIVR